MLSRYRVQRNITKKPSKKVSNKIHDDNPHREHDLKRPILTSSDLVKPDTNIESIIKRTPNKKYKNSLKAGSLYENIESNNKYIDESLHNNIFQMELAMQIFSNDQTVRSNTVQG